MPRPKKARVAPTRPAPTTSAVPFAPVASEPAAKDGASSDIYDLSDREMERKRKRAADAAKKEATANTRTTRARLRGRASARDREALEELDLTRDKAMERLDNLTSTTSAEPQPTHESSDIRSPPLELGRNDEASLRPPRLTDVSGLDLDDSVFGNLDDGLGDDSLELEQGHTQAGGRSVDTSSLFNVALFRRPRQSSIVGRGDAPIRPSSRGPNTPCVSHTLNLGKFKRRAREPSILGTVQKPPTRRPQSQASGDEGANDEAIDTDASAQAGWRRGGRSASRRAESPREPSPTRQPRKRKSLEDHTGGQKRCSLESENNVRQSVERDDVEDEEGELDQANAEDEDSELSELIEPDEVEISTPGARPLGAIGQERPETPAADDPDLLPPLSSGSSDAASPIWPALDTLAHRTYHKRPASRTQKTPDPDGLASDISSPPSLTHSPNYAPPKRKPKAKGRKARAPSPKVTTADLESLLPRRRHQHKSANPFRLDSDEESDNLGESGSEKSGDELSYFDPKGSRRRRLARPLASASGNGKAAGGRAAGKKSRTRRTYGSTNWDKENEQESDGPEDDRDATGEDAGDLPARNEEKEKTAEELKKAAEKFKEVDKWELEFEEVTGSSSPRDAR